MYGDSLAWFFQLARYAIIVLAILSLLACPVGFAVGRWLLPACPECVDPDEPLRAFYRGIYAVCLDLGVPPATCGEVVWHMWMGERHDMPIPGFRWPPLSPEQPDDDG